MDSTGAAGLLIFIVFYCGPWIIAASRRHHNTTAIGVLNLLAGWTILGWLIALIWSFTNPPAPVKAEAITR